MDQASTQGGYDVAVVGAGIVGIAHALAAARAGARVALIDRQAQPTGASLRNFGFVTVTGQERKEMWSLARRARDIWQSVASPAGIPIAQTGMLMVARRPQAASVLEDFIATEMGEACALVTHEELNRLAPGVPFRPLERALVSPHELRVEARTAIPALLRWLAAEWKVDLIMPRCVTDVQAGHVLTPEGEIAATRIFICPGDSVSSLFPSLALDMRVQPCKLQMLRLAPPGFILPSPIMSDLGLIRYEGYCELPSAVALRTALEAEQGEHLRVGVHMIAVQSADGSLVVGDSHEYDDTPDPFQHEYIDQLILDEFTNVLGAPPPATEKWIGTYAWSPDHNWFSKEVARDVHVTVVTCGAGMSTAFAIGEDVITASLRTDLVRLA